MDPDTSEQQTDVQEEGLRTSLKVVCYLSAFFFTSIIIYVFSEFISSMLTKMVNKWFVEEEVSITQFDVITTVGAIYLIFSLSKILGNHLGASGTEIGTSITNFPNPFHDSSYRDGSFTLKLENKRIFNKYKNLSYQYKLDMELYNELEQKYRHVLVRKISI